MAASASFDITSPIDFQEVEGSTPFGSTKIPPYRLMILQANPGMWHVSPPAEGR